MRLLVVLSWLLAVVAQPAWAQGSPKLQQLQHRLAAMVTENPGEYGIAAMDLATGEVVSFNGNEPFPMASTMKIHVAALYLQQVEHGRRSLDDTISGQSARSLMAAMIIRSNNAATDILLRDLGGPDVLQQWIKQNRLSGMRIDRTIAQLSAIIDAEHHRVEQTEIVL